MAPLEASDEGQLLGATALGHCILAFTAKGFVHLAARYPAHDGSILTSQRSSTLVDAPHNLLDTARTSDWIEQVR